MRSQEPSGGQNPGQDPQEARIQPRTPRRPQSSPGPLGGQNPAQRQESSPGLPRGPDCSPGPSGDKNPAQEPLGDQNPAQEAPAGHQEALELPKPWKFSSGRSFANQKFEKFQGLGVPKCSALRKFACLVLLGPLWLEFGGFRGAQTLEILELLICERAPAREFPGFERPQAGLQPRSKTSKNQPLENFPCLSVPKRAKLEPQSPQKRPVEFLECGAFRNAQTLEILEFLIFEITSAREFPGFERPKTRQTRATDAREKQTPRIPRVRSLLGRPNPGIWGGIAGKRQISF